MSSFACVFRVGPITLRVTLVGELAPPPFTVFGWEVAAIHETIASLAGRGVEFVRYEGMDQDAAGVWTAPGGAQVAWFRDRMAMSFRTLAGGDRRRAGDGCR